MREGETVLPAGLPAPAPLPDGLDRPYWEALARHELVAQRCHACARFQWGPEWICHHCHAFELGFAPVPGPALIYAWERVWHPVHPALVNGVPYVVLLVEFPDADGIRMIGNLVGDPRADVRIGALVEPAFEDHGDYSLLQWRAS